VLILFSKVLFVNNVNTQQRRVIVFIDLTSKRFLFVFAPPGGGKDFFEKQIKKFGINAGFVGFGQLLRDIAETDSEEGKTIKFFQDRGDLVPWEISRPVFCKHVSEIPQDLIVINGFPRNDEQCSFIMEGCQDTLFPNPSVHMLVEINRSEERCRENILKSTDRGPREDDNPERIRKRYRLYVDKTEPVIQTLLDSGVKHFQTGDVDDLMPQVEEIIDFFNLIRFNQQLSAPA
jgi:adenylate kinase